MTHQKEVKSLCNEFRFIADMVKSSLADGRKRKW